MSTLELIDREHAAPPAPQHQLSVIESAIQSGATPDQLERIL